MSEKNVALKGRTKRKGLLARAKAKLKADGELDETKTTKKKSKKKTKVKVVEARKVEPKKKKSAKKKAPVKAAAKKRTDNDDVARRIPEDAKLCPQCEKTEGKGEAQITELFGWRTITYKEEKRKIPQSWCKSCRGASSKKKEDVADSEEKAAA